MQNKCDYCGAFISKKALLELSECEYCGKPFKVSSSNFDLRIINRNRLKINRNISLYFSKFFRNASEYNETLYRKLDNPLVISFLLKLKSTLSKSNRKENILFISIIPLFIISVFAGKSFFEDRLFVKTEMQIIEKERKEKELLISEAKGLTQKALKLLGIQFNDVGNMLAKNYIEGNCKAFKITGSSSYGSPHHEKIKDISVLTRGESNKDNMIEWIDSTEALYSDKEKKEKAGQFLYFMVKNKFLELCPMKTPIWEIKSIKKTAREIILISDIN